MSRDGSARACSWFTELVTDTGLWGSRIRPRGLQSLFPLELSERPSTSVVARRLDAEDAAAPQDGALGVPRRQIRLHLDDAERRALG